MHLCRGASEGSSDSLPPSTASYQSDLAYIIRVPSFVINAVGSPHPTLPPWSAFTCVTFTTGALCWFAPVYFTYSITSRNSTLCPSAK